MRIRRRAFLPPATLLPAILASMMANATAQTLPPLQTLVLTTTNNGTTVGAFVQQPISINLRGNPSTGFGWYVAGTNGTSVVSAGPSVFTPDEPGVVGGGGTISLPFLAVNTGATTLSLVYIQPWEPLVVATNYSVTINVTPLPPALSLTLTGGNVLLTWPITNSSGFFLEGVTSLQPAQWAALNVSPQTNGPNYWVTLGGSGAALYFRLHKQ
jgi:predicted secreted protein